MLICAGSCLQKSLHLCYFGHQGCFYHSVPLAGLEMPVQFHSGHQPQQERAETVRIAIFCWHISTLQCVCPGHGHLLL